MPESSPRPSKASATAHCEHSVTSAAQGCSCLYLLRITFKSASSSHAFHCKHSEARWPLSSLWLLADQIRCCWPPCLGSPATFFFFFLSSEVHLAAVFCVSVHLIVHGEYERDNKHCKYRMTFEFVARSSGWSDPLATSAFWISCHVFKSSERLVLVQFSC